MNEVIQVQQEVFNIIACSVQCLFCYCRFYMHWNILREISTMTSSNFTHPISCRLVELYLEKKTVIENPSNRTADANRRRHAAWLNIINLLATENPGFSRTTKQAQKHYQYVKSMTKEKSQNIKRFVILWCCGIFLIITVFCSAFTPWNMKWVNRRCYWCVPYFLYIFVCTLHYISWHH